ncbi:threalose-6-phosphate phosphatase, partial [Cladochytrium tenue]
MAVDTNSGTAAPAPPAPSAPTPPAPQKLIVVTHHLPLSCSLASTAAASEDASRPKSSLANAPAPIGVASPDSKLWLLKPRRGHSALYASINSLRESGPVMHIGWIGQANVACHDGVTSAAVGGGDGGGGKSVDPDWLLSRKDLQAGLQEALSAHDCLPVFLNGKVAYGHYEGYLSGGRESPELWPLFHYILWDTVTDGVAESEYWADYVAMTRAFADAVVAAYTPGDHIWIHDYHLLLLPSMLRERLPADASIGFFLHAPFPSSEIFRCLPKRREVLEGVLGASLIGFQTYSHARHFTSSCTRVLGLETSPGAVQFRGARVAVGIFPIGIDAARAEAACRSPATLDKATALRELYAGRRILVGRDQLDHVKGVEHKLAAFEKFLERYPHWRGRVVLIQVTTPAQRDDPRLESRVSELVARINGQYGSLEFAPVHHYHQQLAVDEYFALLGVADVGLVTSLRDGMNTTSHEFVVCQQDNHGPLVLS